MKSCKLLTVLILLTAVLCGMDDLQASVQSKTIVLRKGVALSEQMIYTNTRYIIRYDFDLHNDEINIPSRCVMEFDGGTIFNGTVNLQNSRLEGIDGFSNVKLTGTCSNESLSSDLFVLDKTGGTDNSVDVQSMFNVGVGTIRFSKGTYSFSDIQVDDVCIYANGSTFVSTLASDGYAVINNVFTANNTSYFKLHNATIQGRKNGSPYVKRIVLSPIDCTNVDDVEISGCCFKELTSACFNAYMNGLYDYRAVSLSCHGCKKVEIQSCEFYDMRPAEWIWIAPVSGGSWDDVEMVRFSNNYFHNPRNDYERSNTPVNVFAKSVIFESNLLEYQKYDGSAFNLQCKNVVVHDNIVRNCYFKSIVDVCEYGDFCNNFVSIHNNDFSAYNSQAVVANAKELIVRNNIFSGISAVLAFATFHNPQNSHSECVDYATITSTPNQKVVIENNVFDCDYVDSNWVSDKGIITGGYCSAITIQSLYCNSNSIDINNNRIKIRDLDSIGVPKQMHQPIYIRNANKISICKNDIDSDVPAMGSIYKGAIFILVYNRERPYDAKQTDVESMRIADNIFRFTTERTVVYPIRISGYSENVNDWVVKEATISNNILLCPDKTKGRIYTTDGIIEKLVVQGDNMDVDKSPAQINKVINTATVRE